MLIPVVNSFARLVPRVTRSHTKGALPRLLSSNKKIDRLVFCANRGFIDPTCKTPEALPNFFPKSGKPDSLYIMARGVAAQRIVNTCNKFGIPTVVPVINGDTERVSGATTYAAFGGEGVPALLDAVQHAAVAKQHGCAAVHPAWGGLSEDKDAHRTMRENGLWVIAPEPCVIEKLGSKISGAEEASKAGLPIIRGTDIVGTVEEALSEMKKDGISFPVMVKAESGGGGKGMKEAHQAADFEAAFYSAKSEALNSFGNDRVFIQELLPKDKSRHVELQMMGDRFGAAKVVDGRDCSNMLNDQKIIEENYGVPSQLALSAETFFENNGYATAGTIEFMGFENSDLTKKDLEIKFLEVNTRLQVEHTVTDHTQDTDLVETQLRVASGQTIEDIFKDHQSSTRHAINIRLNAQEYKNETMMPVSEFPPLTVYPPTIQRDVSLTSTKPDAPSTAFDSCLGLLTVSAKTRPDAIRLARSVLAKTYLPRTSASFAYTYLNELVFRNNKHNTATVGTLLNTDDFKRKYERDIRENPLGQLEKLGQALADTRTNGTLMSGVVNPHLIQKASFPPLPEIPTVSSQWPAGEQTFGQVYSGAKSPFEGARDVVALRKEWTQKGRFLLGNERFRDASQTRDANCEPPREKQLAAPFYNQFPYSNMFMGGGADTHVVLFRHRENPFSASKALADKMPDQIGKMLVRADAVVSYGNERIHEDDIYALLKDHLEKGGIKEFRVFHGLNDIPRMGSSLKAAAKLPAIIELCMVFNKQYSADQIVDYFTLLYVHSALIDANNSADLTKKSEYGADEQDSVLARLQLCIKDAQGRAGMENLAQLKEVPKLFNETVSEFIQELNISEDFQSVLSPRFQGLLQHFSPEDQVKLKLYLTQSALPENPQFNFHGHDARGVHNMMAKELQEAGWAGFDVTGTEMMSTTNTQAPTARIVDSITNGSTDYFKAKTLDGIALFEFALNKHLSPLQGGNEQTAAMATKYGVPPGMINNVRNAFLNLGHSIDDFPKFFPVYQIVLDKILNATGVTPISKDAGDAAITLMNNKVEPNLAAVKKWMCENPDLLPVGITKILIGEKGAAPFGFDPEVSAAVKAANTVSTNEVVAVLNDLEYKPEIPRSLQRLDAKQFPGDLAGLLNFRDKYGPTLWQSLSVEHKLRGLEVGETITAGGMPVTLKSEWEDSENKHTLFKLGLHYATYTSALLQAGGSTTPVLKPGDHKAVVAGQLTSIKKAEGDSVKKGDVIAIITAAKMEISITAEHDGVVSNFSAEVGDSVGASYILFNISD
ncbi:hypothetical protein DID80_04555 [Candidatus Marinamargulisbacteria bacterium SCGC AAA071-K20]|nr:hypothetical protein DID80_04555 [Candidatus Marinamargulisbacteria bacterium SCGC AAA071-K20]